MAIRSQFFTTFMAVITINHYFRLLVVAFPAARCAHSVQNGAY